MQKFWKYHGLGNDFIMISNLDGKIILSKEEVARLCDRHTGIGADGVILVEASKEADCFMNYYNANGTLAEMCGNGVRCVTKFLQDNSLVQKKNLKIATRAGMKDIITEEDGTFSVNMGQPNFSSTDFPAKSTEVENLLFNFASIGNPHAVTFVENLDDYNLAEIGPRIENDPIFPNKINVEFVKEISSKEFKVKVWERGSGITLACGTGACAVYAIAQKYRNAEKNLTIELPGGKLFFSQNENGETIMRGPAVRVFEGEVKL